MTPYASFGKRFLAIILDSIILTIIGMVVGFVLGAVLGILLGENGAGVARGLSSLAGFVIGWLYYALQESSPKQATIGKQAMGIVVTDLEGKRITFTKATVRYVSKILSGLILLIGYIMAAFTEKKQALHDMIAGTLVVEKGTVGDRAPSNF